jgi:aspartate aminotransferase
MEMSERLDDLRRRIREVDGQILKLARDRLELSERIGEEKRRRGFPLINLKVEGKVIDHAQSLAREIGLDEGLSKKLVNTLIAESVKTQKGTPKNRASFLYDTLEKVKELEAKGEKVIRLDVGEPDLASPVEVKDALRDDLYGRSFIGYSSSKGLEELREAIAEDLNGEYGSDITKDQVLLTPGGKFAIFSAIFSKVNFGDRVVIPQPNWPVYENCTRLANGRVDVIHTSFDEEWKIDLQKIEEAFNVNPALLVLCSPNNPTGKIIPEKELKEILHLAARENVYILSDEVYAPYSFKPFKSIMQLANSKVIYVNSFSKRFGMTGWRVGYAVSDVETISRMQKIIQISVTCIPEFVQKAALKALTMKQDAFKAFVLEMRERVKIACEELNVSPLRYLKPDGGMYIYPKATVEGFQSRTFARRLLDEKRVSVAPGEAFGEYPEHFRVSLGINRVDLKKGIKMIGEMAERWLGE